LATTTDEEIMALADEDLDPTSLLRGEAVTNDDAGPAVEEAVALLRADHARARLRWGL
jgi:hypothetical protein